MRTAIRLLLALTLMGWGQLAFSADYTWTATYDSFTRTGSSPSAACSASINAYNAYYNATNSLVSVTPVSGSTNSFTCKWADKNGYSGPAYGFLAIRSGDSCPSGSTYNSTTGECSTPPVDCSAAPDIYSAQECTYSESLKLFSCPDTVNSNGCAYVSSPNGQSNCDISTSICVGRYSPTGNQSAPNAPECTDTTCAPLPSDPGQAPENCVTNGDSTYCFEDQESGCGTFNGQTGCFEDESGCGTFNGTWGCYPTDKDTRNCGYANGEQVCFDPNNPTEQISQDSPDHPANGGNADGNPNNDPKAPGDTSTGAQDGNQGATNEGLEQLGDDLGGKIDKTNSLLGGITGLLDGIGDQLGELLDGLFGDEYDGSGDGDGEAIGSEAQGFGQQLGDLIGEQTEQIIGERDADAKISLEDDIPKLVSGKDGIFDPDGYVVGSMDFLNDVLPSAYGCTDYVIDFDLGQYHSKLLLPVCELTRLKPLLEYLVWMITIVGFWKILYSGLRLEDAKASKGGF